MFVVSNRRIVILFLSVLCLHLEAINGQQIRRLQKLETNNTLKLCIHNYTRMYPVSMKKVIYAVVEENRSIAILKWAEFVPSLTNWPFIAPFQSFYCKTKESKFMLLLPRTKNAQQNIWTAKNTIFNFAFGTDHSYHF